MKAALAQYPRRQRQRLMVANHGISETSPLVTLKDSVLQNRLLCNHSPLENLYLPLQTSLRAKNLRSQRKKRTFLKLQRFMAQHTAIIAVDLFGVKSKVFFLQYSQISRNSTTRLYLFRV